MPFYCVKQFVCCVGSLHSSEPEQSTGQKGMAGETWKGRQEYLLKKFPHSVCSSQILSIITTLYSFGFAYLAMEIKIIEGVL